MFRFIGSLRCPYCKSRLTCGKKSASGGVFGTVSCSCDEYPFFDKLVLLWKDEANRVRRIREIITTGNLYRIIWKCLAGYPILYKLIVIGFYFTHKVFGVRLSEAWLYQLLKASGQNKDWFDYLIGRKQAVDFKFATDILGRRKTDRVLVDIGCGTGILINQIGEFGYVDRQIFGLDKSFLSLLIANLYTDSDKVIFVLADIEKGIPLKGSVGDSAVLLNSLPWISGKKLILQEAARVLKTGGKLDIFNVFSPIGKAKDWGEGILPKDLKKLLGRSFAKIRLVNYPGKKTSRIDDFGYNAFAEKQPF